MADFFHFGLTRSASFSGRTGNTTSSTNDENDPLCGSNCDDNRLSVPPKKKQVYIEKKSIPMIALWCPAFSNHG